MTISTSNAVPSTSAIPSNPYKAWLGGLAVALNVLALIGVMMVFGGSYDSSGSGTLLLVSCGSLGTLFLIAWLIVGAITWRAPKSNA